MGNTGSTVQISPAVKPQALTSILGASGLNDDTIVGQFLRGESIGDAMFVPPLSGGWTPPASSADAQELLRLQAEAGLVDARRSADLASMFVHGVNRTAIIGPCLNAARVSLIRAIGKSVVAKERGFALPGSDSDVAALPSNLDACAQQLEAGFGTAVAGGVVPSAASPEVEAVRRGIVRLLLQCGTALAEGAADGPWEALEQHAAAVLEAAAAAASKVAASTQPQNEQTMGDLLSSSVYGQVVPQLLHSLVAMVGAGTKDHSGRLHLALARIAGSIYRVALATTAEVLPHFPKEVMAVLRRLGEMVVNKWASDDACLPPMGKASTGGAGPSTAQGVGPTSNERAGAFLDHLSRFRSPPTVCTTVRMVLAGAAQALAALSLGRSDPEATDGHVREWMESPAFRGGVATGESSVAAALKCHGELVDAAAAAAIAADGTSAQGRLWSGAAAAVGALRGLDAARAAAREAEAAGLVAVSPFGCTMASHTMAPACGHLDGGFDRAAGETGEEGHRFVMSLFEGPATGGAAAAGGGSATKQAEAAILACAASSQVSARGKQLWEWHMSNLNVGRAKEKLKKKDTFIAVEIGFMAFVWRSCGMWREMSDIAEALEAGNPAGLVPTQPMERIAMEAFKVKQNLNKAKKAMKNAANGDADAGVAAGAAGAAGPVAGDAGVAAGTAGAAGPVAGDAGAAAGGGGGGPNGDAQVSQRLQAAAAAAQRRLRGPKGVHPTTFAKLWKWTAIRMRLLAESVQGDAPLRLDDAVKLSQLSRNFHESVPRSIAYEAVFSAADKDAAVDSHRLAGTSMAPLDVAIRVAEVVGIEAHAVPACALIGAQAVREQRALQRSMGLQLLAKVAASLRAVDGPHPLSPGVGVLLRDLLLAVPDTMRRHSAWLNRVGLGVVSEAQPSILRRHPCAGLEGASALAVGTVRAATAELLRVAVEAFHFARSCGPEMQQTALAAAAARCLALDWGCHPDDAAVVFATGALPTVHAATGAAARTSLYRQANAWADSQLSTGTEWAGWAMHSAAHLLWAGGLTKVELAAHIRGALTGRADGFGPSAQPLRDAAFGGALEAFGSKPAEELLAMHKSVNSYLKTVQEPRQPLEQLPRSAVDGDRTQEGRALDAAEQAICLPGRIVNPGFAILAMADELFGLLVVAITRADASARAWEAQIACMPGPQLPTGSPTAAAAAAGGAGQPPAALASAQAGFAALHQLASEASNFVAVDIIGSAQRVAYAAGALPAPEEQVAGTAAAWEGALRSSLRLAAALSNSPEDYAFSSDKPRVRPEGMASLQDLPCFSDRIVWQGNAWAVAYVLHAYPPSCSQVVSRFVRHVLPLVDPAQLDTLCHELQKQRSPGQAVPKAQVVDTLIDQAAAAIAAPAVHGSVLQAQSGMLVDALAGPRAGHSRQQDAARIVAVLRRLYQLPAHLDPYDWTNGCVRRAVERSMGGKVDLGGGRFQLLVEQHIVADGVGHEDTRPGRGGAGEGLLLGRSAVCLWVMGGGWESMRPGAYYSLLQDGGEGDEAAASAAGGSGGGGGGGGGADGEQVAAAAIRAALRQPRDGVILRYELGASHVLVASFGAEQGSLAFDDPAMAGSRAALLVGQERVLDDCCTPSGDVARVAPLPDIETVLPWSISAAEDMPIVVSQWKPLLGKTFLRMLNRISRIGPDGGAVGNDQPSAAELTGRMWRCMLRLRGLMALRHFVQRADYLGPLLHARLMSALASAALAPQQFPGFPTKDDVGRQLNAITLRLLDTQRTVSAVGTDLAATAAVAGGSASLRRLAGGSGMAGHNPQLWEQATQLEQITRRSMLVCYRAVDLFKDRGADALQHASELLFRYSDNVETLQAIDELHRRRGGGSQSAGGAAGEDEALVGSLRWGEPLIPEDATIGHSSLDAQAVGDADEAEAAAASAAAAAAAGGGDEGDVAMMVPGSPQAAAPSAETPPDLDCLPPECVVLPVPSAAQLPVGLHVVVRSSRARRRGRAMTTRAPLLDGFGVPGVVVPPVPGVPQPANSVCVRMLTSDNGSSVVVPIAVSSWRLGVPATLCGAPLDGADAYKDMSKLIIRYSCSFASHIARQCIMAALLSWPSDEVCRTSTLGGAEQVISLTRIVAAGERVFDQSGGVSVLTAGLKSKLRFFIRQERVAPTWVGYKWQCPSCHLLNVGPDNCHSCRHPAPPAVEDDTKMSDQLVSECSLQVLSVASSAVRNSQGTAQVASAHPFQGQLAQELECADCNAMWITFDPRSRTPPEDSQACVEFFADKEHTQLIARRRGPPHAFKPFLAPAGKVFVKAITASTTGDIDRRWGFECTARGLEGMVWGSEVEVQRSTSLEWGLWVLGFMLNEAFDHDRLAGGLVHRKQMFQALFQYLRAPGLPFKTRIMTVLMNLLSNPGHFATGGNRPDLGELEAIKTTAMRCLAGAPAADRAFPPEQLQRAFDLAATVESAAHLYDTPYFAAVDLSSASGGATGGPAAGAAAAAAGGGAADGAAGAAFDPSVPPASWQPPCQSGTCAPTKPPQDEPVRCLAYCRELAKAISRQARVPDAFAVAAHQIATGKRRTRVADVVAVQQCMQRWTRTQDEELVEWIETKAISQETLMSELKASDLALEVRDRTAYVSLAMFDDADVRYRYALLALLNRYYSACVAVVDQRASLGPTSCSGLLQQVGHLLFTDSKDHVMKRALEQSKSPNRLRIRSNIRLSNPAANTSNERRETRLAHSKCLFAQLFRRLKSKDASAMRCSLDDKDRLFQVVFDGEEGIDWGGIFRSVLSSVTSDLLSHPVNINLFQPTQNAERTLAQGGTVDAFVPRPAATGALAMEMFKFVGVLLGISLRHHQFLDIYLAQPVWKLIAGEPLAAEDVAAVDKEVGEPMVLMASFRPDPQSAVGVQDQFDEHMKRKTFHFVDRSSRLREPLIVNGAQEKVTAENYSLYLTLMLARFRRRYARACVMMRRGLATVVPERAIAICRGKDLQAFVCGPSKVDLALLKQHTRYIRPYTADHPVMQRMWQVLEGYSQKQRQNFIKFAWGRTKLPHGADQWVTGEGKPVQFMVSLFCKGNPPRPRGDQDYIEAHTCFFWLKIPPYSSKEVFERQLDASIVNGLGSGFQIA